MNISIKGTKMETNIGQVTSGNVDITRFASFEKGLVW